MERELTRHLGELSTDRVLVRVPVRTGPTIEQILRGRRDLSFHHSTISSISHHTPSGQREEEEEGQEKRTHQIAIHQIRPTSTYGLSIRSQDVVRRLTGERTVSLPVWRVEARRRRSRCSGCSGRRSGRRGRGGGGRAGNYSRGGRTNNRHSESRSRNDHPVLPRNRRTRTRLRFRDRTPPLLLLLLPIHPLPPLPLPMPPPTLAKLGRMERMISLPPSEDRTGCDIVIIGDIRWDL